MYRVVLLYKSLCRGCDGSYIGEFERKTRLKEHVRDMEKSAHATRSNMELGEHCWETGHSLDFDSAVTLASKTCWGA